MKKKDNLIDVFKISFRGDVFYCINENDAYDIKAANDEVVLELVKMDKDEYWNLIEI